MTRIHVAVIAALAAVAGGLLVLAFHRSSSSSDSGSGHSISQTRMVSPFDAVDLAGSNRVLIHVGGKQSVVVQADDNLIGKVTTTVAHGTLRIETNGSFSTKSPMSVDVTVPSLQSLTLSGSGLVVATGIDAQKLTVLLSGSGLLTATGRVGTLDASLPGAGSGELSKLVAKDVTAVVSGSGRLGVHATNTLDATVSGTGVIQYTGSPVHVTKNVTGTGAITGG